MAFRAEVHKSGFQAWLYTGYATLVDIGFLLLTGAGFDVEVKQTLAVNQGYAQLFGMSRIDQHSFHGKKWFLSFGLDRKPGE